MADDGGRQVLLFNMPWVDPEHAPLGISLVRSTLTQAGLRAQVHHPNLDYFSRLSSLVGTKVARRVFHHGIIGELIAGAAFRSLSSGPIEAAYAPHLEASGISEDTFRTLVEDFSRYSDAFIAELDLSEVAACGFTLCIRQTMASLLWARKLKALKPEIAIVFGGSHCEDPMGLALMEATPFIDYVARGESDTSIAPMFLHIAGRGQVALDDIPNIAFRRGGEIVATEKRMINMRQVVEPDYTEYRQAYPAFAKLTGVAANYYVEGSRGCWWGEKHHCVFCGINTSSMTFRQKTSDALLRAVEKVVTDNASFRFVLSDTIFSLTHLNDILPALQAVRARFDIEFFLETKSNLKKEQIFALARAGCTAFQPGIESFSDRILRLMDKGSSALQQIQFLKWAKEAGILPAYSILTHVVGEQADDYRETLSYIGNIGHLDPPAGVAQIEINRYAPYYNRWAELGFAEPVPAPYYRLMFGDDGGPDLRRFAYHFDGVHPTVVGAELEAAREAVRTEVDHWRNNQRRTQLALRIGPGFAQVRRTGRINDSLDLHGDWAELYLACDRITSLSKLEHRFSPSLGAKHVRDFLADLCASGYMIKAEDRDHYLALAVNESCWRPELSDGQAASWGRPEIALSAVGADV